jgi:predicted signal transduction protein with EAL and GGDEF domain
VRWRTDRDAGPLTSVDRRDTTGKTGMKPNEFNTVAAETEPLAKSFASDGRDKAGSLNLSVRKGLAAAGDRIANIGIALFPDHGQDETLVQLADAAMFEAKQAGGNGFRIYNAASTARAATRSSSTNCSPARST